MKYILVAYIKSESLLQNIEGIANYYGLNAVEDNRYYKMLMGYYNAPLSIFIDNLYNELDGQSFDIEDTISVIYTRAVNGGNASLGNIVLKRKGNIGLRRRAPGN